MYKETARNRCEKHTGRHAIKKEACDKGVNQQSLFDMKNKILNNNIKTYDFHVIQISFFTHENKEVLTLLNVIRNDIIDIKFCPVLIIILDQTSFRFYIVYK